MKKLIPFALAVIMLFALSGCSRRPFVGEWRWECDCCGEEYYNIDFRRNGALYITGHSRHGAIYGHGFNIDARHYWRIFRGELYLLEGNPGTPFEMSEDGNRFVIYDEWSGEIHYTRISGSEDSLVGVWEGGYGRIRFLANGTAEAVDEYYHDEYSRHFWRVSDNLIITYFGQQHIFEIYDDVMTIESVGWGSVLPKRIMRLVRIDA
ncbi:MAG: hypothetical protein FWB93_06765 [Oscillospiraceae bacterium]|nr:hypothetical protein [Oscillospiraceae bacterium]